MTQDPNTPYDTAAPYDTPDEQARAARLAAEREWRASPGADAHAGTRWPAPAPRKNRIGWLLAGLAALAIILYFWSR